MESQAQLFEMLEASVFEEPPHNSLNEEKKKKKNKKMKKTHTVEPREMAKDRWAQNISNRRINNKNKKR